MPRTNKTLIFNNPNDNIQITAHRLRSSNDMSLNIDTSHNLFITSQNLVLNDSDLSTNVTVRASNYYINGISLEQFVTQQTSGSEFILQNTDTSLNNVDISGDLKLTNANKTFTVAGTSTMQDLNAGATDISDTLQVGGASTLQDLSAGATDISSTLNVTGATTLSSTLQVDNAATFSNSIAVISDSTFNSSLTVSNELIIGDSSSRGGRIYSGSDNSQLIIDPYTYDNNSGTLIIKGGLQVLGTTTTINSTIVDISDKTLKLASNATNSTAADGAGFEISGAEVSFLYSSSLDQFVSSIDISAGTFIGALTGNASTASTLETSRTITLDGDLGGSVNFNGSANVTLTATIQPNSVALGTYTTGNYVATLATTDEGVNYLTIANSGIESAAVTIDISASTSNDASTIVARDTNGNINANLTGNVTSSGTSSFATLNASSDVTFSQNLDVSGLDVSNNATVGGTLDVTGATTLTGSLSANGGISILGDLVTANSDSKLFVSKSTFEIVNDYTTLGTDNSNVSGSWITPSGYSKQINLKSSNSAVKMEFKVNFRASPEADQFISFQVTRGSTPDISVVFQDCSLGSNMGITLTNVYNGTFIDTTPGDTDVTYTLHYKLDCPSTNTIDTAFGILGGANNRNYIYLQELYVP